MTIGVTQLDSSPSPGPYPVSSVIPTGTSVPKALEGGPVVADTDQKAPASIWVKDGNNVAQGSTTDADTVSTVMGRLTKLRNIFVDVWDSVNHRIKVDGSGVTQPVSGSVSVSNFPGTQPVSAASLPLPAGAALEAGHLATIDSVQGTALDANTVNSVIGRLTKIRDLLNATLTISGAVTTSGTVTEANSAAIKTDLDAINTNTTGAATAANQTTGNTSLSSIATNTTGLATQTTLAAAKTDLDTLVTQTAAQVQGAGAAAGTAWRMKGDFTEQASLSAGSLNADLVPATDVSAYKSLSLHINANAYSGTLTFAGSNDNVTFTTILLYNAGNANNVTGTTTATNLIFVGNVAFRYFRVRMTSYTSGTAQGTLELYTWPIDPYNLGTVTANSVPNATSSNVGTSDSHLISAASTNATLIKAGAGQVYGYEIANANAAIRYVKLYSKASAPTVGTDVPLRTIGVPAGGRASYTSTTGMKFALGIGFATTTGIADNDATAVAANDLSIDIDWN